MPGSLVSLYGEGIAPWDSRYYRDATGIAERQNEKTEMRASRVVGSIVSWRQTFETNWEERDTGDAMQRGVYNRFRMRT